MRTALRLDGLTKRFGGLTAVDGLDLEVQEGEIIGFLGPNGAGKTTTIRMISGLARPTAGSVTVGGQRISPGDSSARRLIGLCPQENVLYPELTARENLLFIGSLYGLPGATRRQAADRLLEAVGLAAKATARVDTLSGGMKRRLTLAAALVHDPPIVVLDEPEAGLDPQARLAVREFVQGLRRERTVILTSHNMDEVDRVADRVAVIDHGRLLALGTPKELKRQHGGHDSIAITLEGGDLAKVERALAGKGAPLVERVNGGITVHGEGLARQLPEIIRRIDRAKGIVGSVEHRATTLEDVFIALTGRGLRE